MWLFGTIISLHLNEKSCWELIPRREPQFAFLCYTFLFSCWFSPILSHYRGISGHLGHWQWETGYRTGHPCWEGRYHGLAVNLWSFQASPCCVLLLLKQVLGPRASPAFLESHPHSELMRQKEGLCKDLSAVAHHWGPRHCISYQWWPSQECCAHSLLYSVVLTVRKARKLDDIILNSTSAINKENFLRMRTGTWNIRWVL